MALYQEYMPLIKRVHGAESSIALQLSVYYASSIVGSSLVGQGQLAEAEAIITETMPVLKRVLGDHHPLTVVATGLQKEFFNKKNTR
jgi:hypothetical protein